LTTTTTTADLQKTPTDTLPIYCALRSRQRLLVISLLESALCSLPVDYLPDGLEIIGFPVLILQAEARKCQHPFKQVIEPQLTSRHVPRRRFQGVGGTAQQLDLGSVTTLAATTTRLIKRHNYGISLNQNIPSLRILDKPCPSAALDACQCRIELLLQLIQATILFVDGLGKSTSRWLSTPLLGGGQVLPE
jgi:hypothetical protein